MAPIIGRTCTLLEGTADSPEVMAHLDPLQVGPELHLGHPVVTMADI